ncbi:MAG: hypothetical protein JW819_02675 [Candidatus Krumholzibacteriota bacterium]|nr:hypothetical protein [Candidatus Krumholzibacteriota bacterium]
MAHAYTPGLKVLRETKIQKIRLLPLKGKLRVQAGDEVTPHKVVAATELPGNVQMVNVAGQINIDPTDVGDCMLKTEGEAVKRGEPLARSKGIFGLFKSTLDSPADGTVESISSVTGQVVLREAPIPVQVDAYIQGKVIEELPEEGVVVETTGTFIQGIFGIGGERQGEIKVIVSGPGEKLDPGAMDASCRGKVLIAGSFCSLAAFRRAMELEVAGIIVGGFNYEDLKPILGFDLGVAITGGEQIPTTLVVTEGFGTIAMAHRTFDLLSRHAGKVASINGATQIRAGVIRPEVIIPLTGSELEGIDAHVDSKLGIEDGSLVRVIRAPHFGVLGRVRSLPPELREMESGTLVRVAEVELDDGTMTLLPRANLEMVETD